MIIINNIEGAVLKNFTVGFPKRDNMICLAKKTRVFKDKRNGYGGLIEPGETEESSFLRELREESGGVISEARFLEKIAVVDNYTILSAQVVSVYRIIFFIMHEWHGLFQESEEMLDPQFFHINALPFQEMIVTDVDWLFAALSGQRLHVKTYLDVSKENKVRPTEVREVSNFEKLGLLHRYRF